jgi:hypothetical protein
MDNISVFIGLSVLVLIVFKIIEHLINDLDGQSTQITPLSPEALYKISLDSCVSYLRDKKSSFNVMSFVEEIERRALQAAQNGYREFRVDLRSPLDYRFRSKSFCFSSQVDDLEQVMGAEILDVFCKRNMFRAIEFNKFDPEVHLGYVCMKIDGEIFRIRGSFGH